MQLENKIRIPTPRFSHTVTLLDELMDEPLMAERTIALGAGVVRLSLERTVWEGLEDAARSQGRLMADLCGELDAVKPPGMELSTAIRTFVLRYYREAEEV